MIVLVLWIPLAAFADPMSFGTVSGGLPYRIPTAAGFAALWFWLRPTPVRSRRAIENGVLLTYSFLFVAWGVFVTKCSADTVLPAMFSILGGAMLIASGLILTWQSTGLLCLVADGAMLTGGLLREPSPGPTYFMLIATGFILYPFVVSNAVARDRRYHAELESNRQLAELNEQLRREQDARTRLFVNLSHDFRTPLAVIRAEVELLRRTDGQSSTRALARIDANAAAVVDLVEQLLELARLDAGKTPLSARSCDLQAAAAEVLAQLTPARTDIELRLSVLGDCHATVDPAHFRRVLQNLVANALRQVDKLGGLINVTIRPGANASLLVEVSDSGPGIAPAIRARLFDRFASFRPEGGTASGIGLALARELTELNFGELTLLEHTEQTTFQVSLPRSSPDVPGAEPAQERTHRAVLPSLSEQEQESGPGTQSGLRPQVLVVEDNADLRSGLERLLAPDFVVVAAATLASALRAVSRGRPAAVLTDIMLPDGNGYELLAALRSKFGVEQVPVLFVSALSETSEREQGLAAGADDYISKPFIGTEVVARVKAAIRRSLERQAALELQRSELLSELHDGVCGSLANALIAIDKLAACSSIEHSLLERAASSVRDGLREARELLNALGTAPESLDSLVSGLRWETACASDRAGLTLDFSVAREVEALSVSPAALHALRRVASEAIVNAARHGAAGQVTVKLVISASAILLRIEDDGAGNAAAVPPGIGLNGLCRRVARLGGNTSFGNGALGGFVVEASLPALVGAPP